MLNFIMYDIKNVIFKKYSINQNNSKKSNKYKMQLLIKIDKL